MNFSKDLIDAIDSYDKNMSNQAIREETMAANNEAWRTIGVGGDSSLEWIAFWMVIIGEGDPSQFGLQTATDSQGKPIGQSMLSVQNGKISTLTSEMDYMTAYRNIISQAQSIFNAAESGPVDEQELRGLLNLLIDPQFLNAGIFDEASANEIRSSVTEILSVMDKWSSKGGLEGLWAAAQNKDDTSGAADDLKKITDAFNSLNNTVSVMNQTVQTELNYVVADLEQWQALCKNFYSLYSKQNEAIVDNQKTG